MIQETIYQMESWLDKVDKSKINSFDSLRVYLAVQEWVIKNKRANLEHLVKVEDKKLKASQNGKQKKTSMG